MQFKDKYSEISCFEPIRYNFSKRTAILQYLYMNCRLFVVTLLLEYLTTNQATNDNEI